MGFLQNIKKGATTLTEKGKEALQKYQAEAAVKKEQQREISQIQAEARREASKKEAAEYGRYQAQQEYKQKRAQLSQPRSSPTTIFTGGNTTPASNPLGAFGSGTGFSTSPLSNTGGGIFASNNPLSNFGSKRSVPIRRRPKVRYATPKTRVVYRQMPIRRKVKTRVIYRPVRRKLPKSRFSRPKNNNPFDNF